MNRFVFFTILIFFNVLIPAYSEPIKFNKENSFEEFGIASYYRPFEVRVENQRLKTFRLTTFSNFDDPKLGNTFEDSVQSLIAVSRSNGLVMTDTQARSRVFESRKGRSSYLRDEYIVSCIDGTFRLLKSTAYDSAGKIKYVSEEVKVKDISDSQPEGKLRDKLCKKLRF
jgi:hypothetical protein